MAAAKRPAATPPAAEERQAETGLIELESIETLFDRRMRARDTTGNAKTRYFWDGTWIRIVKNGRSGQPRTFRLSPVGVIMGPTVGSDA